MATNMTLKMHVDLLRPEQVKYELSIRNKFSSTDNQEYRKRKLKNELEVEKNLPHRPIYSNTLDFEIDYQNFKAYITDAQQYFDSDGITQPEQIDLIETVVVHLSDRADRLNPTEALESEVEAIKKVIEGCINTIVAFHNSINGEEQNDDRQSQGDITGQQQQPQAANSVPNNVNNGRSQHDEIHESDSVHDNDNNGQPDNLNQNWRTRTRSSKSNPNNEFGNKRQQPQFNTNNQPFGETHHISDSVPTNNNQGRQYNFRPRPNTESNCRQKPTYNDYHQNNEYGKQQPPNSKRFPNGVRPKVPHNERFCKEQQFDSDQFRFPQDKRGKINPNRYTGPNGRSEPNKPFQRNWFDNSHLSGVENNKHSKPHSSKKTHAKPKRKHKHHDYSSASDSEEVFSGSSSASENYSDDSYAQTQGRRNTSRPFTWQTNRTRPIDFRNIPHSSPRNYSRGHSPSHGEYNWFAPNNGYNVLKWKFHFSGLSMAEDPKGLEIDHFMQKVCDYGQSENISQSEILEKMCHLLRGPAEDWYRHARRNINSWSEFKQKLKSRFSTLSGTDAIQQMIYSKKQFHGENTLRFIDQFINLINRLPYEVSEKRCLRWIIKGIRPEIAVMARTKGVETIDELSRYVKKNFGAHDKMFDKNHRSNHSANFRSIPRNVSEARVYVQSDAASNSDSDSDSSKNVVEEVEQYTSHRPGKRGDNKNKTTKSGNKSNLHVKPIENPKAVACCAQTHCCQASQVNWVSNQSIHNKSALQGSVNPPALAQIESNKMQPIGQNMSFPCPFCNGNHAYRSCPLPMEQKYKRCFKCGAVGETANTCSCKQSAAVPEREILELQNSHLAAQPSDNNEICMASLIPNQIYVESLIYFPAHDPRPHVKTIANGIVLNGLLDTGAHATLIGINMYESISDWKTDLRPVESHVVTADGNRHDCLGAMLINFELNGKQKTIPLIVVNMSLKRPIFGMDFQRCFGIGLAFIETSAVEIFAPKEQLVLDSHELSEEQSKLLLETVKKIPKVPETGVLNCTDKIEHKIGTGLAKAIYMKPYIFSTKLQEKIRAEIYRLIERGIIEKVPSSSWLNAVIAVPKSDGSIRLCIDARKLNAITKKNTYPQMNIDRIMSRISGATYFSSIDLKDAFYQIALHEKDREKTAFAVHGMGIFRYKRMPMGLVNSAATLCELIESVFNIESEPEIFVYLDDFIVATDSFERHIEVLNILCDKLKEIGLAIGTKKSNFCMKRLKFLGHIFSKKGVEIDPERTSAINAIKKPATVKQVRSFLGAVGWHEKFIKNYSDLAAPLTDLTKKKNDFIWSERHEKAFVDIKEKVSAAPVLALPSKDKPFVIECSSSDIAVSAEIYQKLETGKEVIAYMSAKLSDAQQKFHPIERNCLAVIVALEKFRIYFYGQPVTVFSDDSSISWLQNCKDPTGRMAR